ncbi:gluconate 2-dehydrogenase subunit 3 family protein [Mesorhizobium xinjiangense]|uniref:gluconate 2-dehydrogenase subunit 3 family protein n=1 Tax=Mesorhizobium xinjiangense TaxID=2678685 RepID=UPI0012EE1514|nr:gluconate 2-dehydrogenase subunit 3 family protein [Mesorhizobium xinjiangense]
MSTSAFKTTRRQLLQSAAAGAALSAITHPAWAQSAPAVPLDEYEPTYFSAQEWAFILAATARLIPSEGDGPGAIEARVPVFIDLQLAGDFGIAADWYMDGPHDPAAPAQLGYQSPLNPAEVYRAAIAELDDWCSEEHGAPFAELEAETQNAVLTALENGELTLSSTQGASFFGLLLQNTKEGYFADPKYGGNHGMAAWVHIGFPGARASFLEWVGIERAYPLGPVSIAGERA